LADTSPALWLREPRAEIFTSHRVSIGRFRRHPSEPDFRQTGPTGSTLLVFPRLPVRIAQAGRNRVVADPTVVMLYNAGQEYERAAVSPDGDRCDWFAFRSEDVAEALGGDVDPAKPFTQPCVPAASRLVARERALFVAAAGRQDALEIEEAALGLLAATFAHALPTGAWRELADAARERLARVYLSPVSLGEIARALGRSPFHLCRVFRAATGRTVHQHLTALRLHTALELIPAWRGDLSGLALELGFAHHAHFTAAFRAAFGMSPTAWAGRLERARSR
jgi:AraC family transcriptional regulator